MAHACGWKRSTSLPMRCHGEGRLDPRRRYGRPPGRSVPGSVAMWRLATGPGADRGAVAAPMPAPPASCRPPPCRSGGSRDGRARVAAEKRASLRRRTPTAPPPRTGTAAFRGLLPRRIRPVIAANGSMPPPLHARSLRQHGMGYRPGHPRRGVAPCPARWRPAAPAPAVRRGGGAPTRPRPCGNGASAYQMRTRWAGARYSVLSGLGANAAYHGSMLRTMSARCSDGECGSVSSRLRSSAGR